jgi:hypothetical protein
LSPPHFAGYPILVRLDHISVDRLSDLGVDAPARPAAERFSHNGEP